MKIAYLVSQYPAASHTFIRREVAALRRRGLTIQTFSVRQPDPGDLSDDNRSEALSTFVILSQPVTVFLYSHLRALINSPLQYVRTFALALNHRPPGLRGLLLSLAHFVEAILLAGELSYRNITQLHTHFANSAATVGLLAAKFAGVGWSFVMHGPSETDYPAGYLLAEKVRAANIVIAVSWFAHSQSMRLVPPDHWTKFRLVHCGIELDQLPRIQTQTKRKTIICVGRLCSDKAQAGLLIAFAMIAEYFPEVSVHFVGDGRDLQALESLTLELGISHQVEFLGRLPESETMKRISQSDLMVLPSFWEGLPVVLMEAMAIGVPVITSRIAGIPEMIEDGVNGLLFAPARWNELADCITRLLTSPDLAERLTVAARQTIQDHFDIKQSSVRLEKFFGELGRTEVHKSASGLSDKEHRVCL